MHTWPSSGTPHPLNTATIGAAAQVEMIALGNNNTQIKGYTAEQVNILLTTIRSEFQLKPFDGRSPYVGLATFQEQDADRFFGREKLVRVLVARISTSRFLVIAGPSGSGKSSLARAGLIPAPKGGALPNSDHWLYETLTPGRHPLTELGRVITSLYGQSNAGAEIVRNGRTDPTLLHSWAEAALGDQRTRRLILLLDQFEEVFTQVADETERAGFIDLLTYALNAENGRVTIVCSTRSDFLGSWAAYPSLNAQLSRGVIQIPPMQPDELVSAIARPAIQVGVQIDPDLVKQVLDDMQASPGALPFMQFALDDLFRHEKSKGGVIALTRDGYLKRGGLQKALARHADAEFIKLSPNEQDIARTIFSRLVEPGRGTVDTKRTALFDELGAAGIEPAQTRRVLTKLADAHLVITDAQDKRETVTLAHERLIDAWGWLRRLVDENREAITLQNEIAEDAQEWDQKGRKKDYLYGGARLATAQEEVKKQNVQLSALAQEFVSAGKQKYRTTRLTIAASLVLGTAILVAIATLGLTGGLNALFYRPLPMEWKDVPAGDFTMGSTDQEIAAANTICASCVFKNEQPPHTVYLDAYKINRTEVTNTQFNQCERAGVCEASESADSDDVSMGEYPVTGVSWTNAQKFCKWAEPDGRLPTEAEWEKAARGTSDAAIPARIYPWGPTWDPSKANAARGTKGKVMKIRSFPKESDSPYQVSDMAGNVWEWVSDWYDRAYYADSPPINPFGPTLATRRVIRGGSFASDEIAARSVFRTSYSPKSTSADVGFRCVRSTLQTESIDQ